MNTIKNPKASTFEEVLSGIGVDEAKIAEIYSGKDHACRCGCKGKYYSPTSKSYGRIIKALKKSIAEHTARLVEADYTTLRDGTVELLNIPVGEVYKDKCYCIYFKH